MPARFTVFDENDNIGVGDDVQVGSPHGFFVAEVNARERWRQYLGKRRFFICKLGTSPRSHLYWEVKHKWEWLPSDDDLVRIVETRIRLNVLVERLAKEKEPDSWS